MTFRLRKDVSWDEYLEWFHRVNVPAARQVKSIMSYQVWRVEGVSEGEPFDVLEEMDITDRETFEGELESVPAMKAMLEQWYERVADPVVVYANEVPLTRAASPHGRR